MTKMVKIEAKFLFALIFLKLAWTFHLETKEARERVGIKDRGSDKFDLKGGWQQDRTILEQFYDYVKNERDIMEKRMGNRIFNLGKVVMKIPKKKGGFLQDFSRMKRSNLKSNLQSKDHIEKIKEEIAKLQDLIIILKDQQNIIGFLNNNQNVNLTLFAKEFVDLRNYVKNSVADKLEKEISERQTTDENILKELQKQKDTLENIKGGFLKQSVVKQNKTDEPQSNIIDNIVKELKNLEMNISEMTNKNNRDDPILKSKEKMRQSSLGDLLDDEDDEDLILKRLIEAPHQKSGNSLKKLVRLFKNLDKKKKQKSLFEELLNKIDRNDVENKEIDVETEETIEDRLKTLKEEIDNFQKSEPEENVESKKLEEILKILAKPKPNVKKENQLEGLIKKLTQGVNVNNKGNVNDHNQKKFHLYNCKYVQEEDAPFKFENPSENPHKNFGLHENYYPPPNGLVPSYNQQRYDQNFVQNQLFPDLYQSYFGQQRYIAPYTQEYQTNPWRNYNGNIDDKRFVKPKIVDVKNQIFNLQNIVNDLNNPAYLQRVEDQVDLYDLNQQIDDLKNAVSVLEKDQNYSRIQDVNQNVYRNQQVKDFRDFNKNNPDIDDNQQESFEGYDNKPKSRSNGKNDLNNKIKRSTSKNLEESLSEIIRDELDQDDFDSEETAGDSNENELDANEESINDKERGLYHSGYNKKTKKVTIFDRIFDKILNKIVDKAQIAIPKIIRALFDFKSIFGFDPFFNNVKNYSNNQFGNFGLLGFLPMFVLKLVSLFNSFIYQLQQFPFFKNFLMPALIILGVSGLTVFLTWWMQPNNNNNYDYKQLTYQQNQKPFAYNTYSNYQPYNVNPPPNSNGYGGNSLNYNPYNYRNVRYNNDLYKR